MDKIKHLNLVAEAYSILPPPPPYQRVEYLQSSSGNGTADAIHIDTGIAYFADFEIECMRTDNQQTKFAGVSSDYCLQRNGSDGLFAFYSSTYYVSSASILQRTVCKWKDGNIYINGECVTSSVSKTLNPYGYNSHFSLYGAMGADGSGAYYTNIRIYYCKLWNPSDGTLVRDMYPCRRTADNVLGFYDAVTDTFFTPTGRGSLLAGSDVQ